MLSYDKVVYYNFVLHNTHFERLLYIQNRLRSLCDLCPQNHTFVSETEFLYRKKLCRATNRSTHSVSLNNLFAICCSNTVAIINKKINKKRTHGN